MTMLIMPEFFELINIAAITCVMVAGTYLLIRIATKK